MSTFPTTPRQFLDDWLRKARLAASLGLDEPWPAWSTGETLAVALILDDAEMLDAMDYTVAEALERLRYDIGARSVEAAAKVFAELRRLHRASTGLG